MFIQNSTIQQITYDFLSVWHCKYSSILHHFWHIWRWRISSPRNLVSHCVNLIMVCISLEWLYILLSLIAEINLHSL